ncbi:MAG: hypothetical protein ACQES7_04265 [Pseudomonadota bacterium]
MSDNTKPISKEERARQIDREQSRRFGLRPRIDQLRRDMELKRQLDDWWDHDD